MLHPEAKNLPATKEETLTMIEIVKSTLVFDKEALADAVDEGDYYKILEEQREVADSEKDLAALEAHLLTFQ